jgi:hypothetical protein
MEAIQQQMVVAKKNERANALKEVKRLCKEFGFTAGMLKGSLAEGRKKKLLHKRRKNVQSGDGVTHLLHTYYGVTISD